MVKMFWTQYWCCKRLIIVNTNDWVTPYYERPSVPWKHAVITRLLCDILDHSLGASNSTGSLWSLPHPIMYNHQRDVPPIYIREETRPKLHHLFLGEWSSKVTALVNGMFKHISDQKKCVWYMLTFMCLRKPNVNVICLIRQKASFYIFP